MASASLLSLPAELRNEIYTLVFLTLTRPLRYPWDDGKACTTILSLLLANRQVHSEVSSLLRCEPPENLRFDFDNGTSFENFFQSILPRHPQLQSARFRLRVTVPNKRALNIAAHADDFQTIKQLLCPGNEIIRFDTLEFYEPTPAEYWAHLHNPIFYSKYPVRDPTARAVGRRCARYWICDRSFSTNGFKWTSYAWDSWLVGDDGRQTLRGEEAGFDVAWGRKMRSECIVVEGRIADAVKARLRNA